MKRIIGIIAIIATVLSFWLILSSCSIKGVPGEKGEKGDNGASIESVEYDECGRLVITLTDGTVLNPIEILESSTHSHSFGEWYTISEASCKDDGLKIKFCLTCGNTTSDVIESSDSFHKYEAIITSPTCSNQGYTTHVCNICGDTKVVGYTNQISCEEYCDCPHFSTKTYVAFGDSITYGVDGTLDKWGLMPEPYPMLVGELLGLKSVENRGISGATLCSDSARTNMTANILAFNGDADIISVMLGVNDYMLNMPLGNSGSRKNDTIYGSLFMIAEHLSANYPDATVFFITPFPTIMGGGNNPSGKYTLADVAEAVKYVAATYDFPVLDFYTDGKYELEMIKPTNDGVHPSQEHFRAYTAPQIAKFIEECIEGKTSFQKESYLYTLNYESGYIDNSGSLNGVGGLHHYCSIDAEGIEKIIITPPITIAYNTTNLYYVIYVDENGNITLYAPISKSTPTIIELNGEAKGTIYFNALTDELNYFYAKEAVIITQSKYCYDS